MTASSQNPPGALPPEAPHDPRPLQAAVASYAGVLPVPAGPAAPAVTDVQAATGVLTAAMEQGHTAPAELAQAERDAGILFDPQRAKDIADAAYEQAKAECHAELHERGKQLAVMTDRARNLQTALAERRRTLEAILRLCEGRPVSHYLPVGAILDAAAHARTPYDTAPLTITWDGLVMGPSGDTPNENTLVPCTTALGGAAALVLNDEQRRALASLLQLEVRDIHAPCPTDGCGTVDDYDASDPSLFGWSRLEVASLGDGPRWYCSDMCVFDALARAGHDLAAEDQAAAVDPDEQVPYLLTDDIATVEEADEARCQRCGCTENTPCKGGCLWAPNNQNIDLCTQCVTPEELVYAVRVTEDVSPRRERLRDLLAAQRAMLPQDQAADLDARYGPGASDEYALQQAEATEAAFEDERGDADEDGAW